MNHPGIRSLVSVKTPSATDRMFNGDTLHRLGWLDYLKARRAGLVFSGSGAGAESDDSWRDDEGHGDLSAPAEATDQL